MVAFLSIISLCESTCYLLFALTVSSPPLFYLALASLLSEPLLYYLFTCYIAMRNIASVSHLLAMVYSIPFYYLLLLGAAVLKVNLHENRFLSRLIHYTYSPTCFHRQLMLHMGCVTAPGAVVAGVDLAVTGGGATAGCALGVLVLAGATYIVRLASRVSKPGVELTETSLGEVLPTENTGEDDLETL